MTIRNIYSFINYSWYKAFLSLAKKSKRTSFVLEFFQHMSTHWKRNQSSQHRKHVVFFMWILSATPHYITTDVDTLNKTRVDVVPDPRSPSTQLSIAELRVWLVKLDIILGKWPTTTPSFITETSNGSYPLLISCSQIKTWVVYSLPVWTKTAIFNYIHAP